MTVAETAICTRHRRTSTGEPETWMVDGIGYLQYGYCPTCGARLNADGTSGPSAAVLEAALDLTLEAVARALYESGRFDQVGKIDIAETARQSKEQVIAEAQAALAKGADNTEAAGAAGKEQ